MPKARVLLSNTATLVSASHTPHSRADNALEASLSDAVAHSRSSFLRIFPPELCTLVRLCYCFQAQNIPLWYLGDRHNA
jgi:hypothetical protein